MQSPLPGNEAARSRVLWNYRILDTPPEERFDDLVRVATYICGTPIGLVGLIDAGREWFKSRVGWDLSEIPREISFGTHTITQPDVLIVSDTLKDERFVRNQLGHAGGSPFLRRGPLADARGIRAGNAVSDGLCSAGPDRRADAHPVGPGAAGGGASGRPARFGIESRKGFV